MSEYNLAKWLETEIKTCLNDKLSILFWIKFVSKISGLDIKHTNTLASLDIKILAHKFY